MKIKTTVQAVVVSVATALFTQLPAHASPGAVSFTPEQQAAIGQIAADYLREHPDLLVEMSEKLQQRENAAEQHQALEAVLANQKRLLNAKEAPTVRPDGDVTLIQFFDYQCIWCSRMAPVVEAVMDKDASLRVAFREYPIFGERWPLSRDAAIRGVSIWRQQGADAYARYHHALFKTGHAEGQLTQADIRQAAQLAGADMQNVGSAASDAGAEIDLKGNAALAGALGIIGTPAFVVMPTKGANADNTSVMYGAVDASTLQAAIAKARGKTAGKAEK
ncbi:DsbA family protein [Serratia marcescens]|nr:DsbA family protein [Serratia marcescens]